MKKSGPCKKAIIKDGKIIGWETFRRTSKPKQSPKEWALSAAGKAAMLHRILSEQRLGEADFLYYGEYPLLQPQYRGGQFRWVYIPTE